MRSNWKWWYFCSNVVNRRFIQIQNTPICLVIHMNTLKFYRDLQYISLNHIQRTTYTHKLIQKSIPIHMKRKVVLLVKATCLNGVWIIMHIVESKSTCASHIYTHTDIAIYNYINLMNIFQLKIICYIVANTNKEYIHTADDIYTIYS